MENFNNMTLCELINLWTDMSLIEFEHHQLGAQYFKKRIEIEEVIAEKFGFSYKDTTILLSSKIRRIKAREAIDEYTSKYLAKIDSRLKDTLYQLEEIRINITKLFELDKSK